MKKSVMAAGDALEDKLLIALSAGNSKIVPKPSHRTGFFLNGEPTVLIAVVSCEWVKHWKDCRSLVPAKSKSRSLQFTMWIVVRQNTQPRRRHLQYNQFQHVFQEARQKKNFFYQDVSQRVLFCTSRLFSPAALMLSLESLLSRCS